MKKLFEGMGYLKGVFESKTPDELDLNAFLAKLVEVMSGILENTAAVHDQLEALSSYVERIDDDLAMLEDDFDDDFPIGIGDDEEDKPAFGFDDDDTDEDEEEETGVVSPFRSQNAAEYISVCPVCGCAMRVKKLGGMVLCPGCDERVPAEHPHVSELPLAESTDD